MRPHSANILLPHQESVVMYKFTVMKSAEISSGQDCLLQQRNLVLILLVLLTKESPGELPPLLLEVRLTGAERIPCYLEHSRRTEAEISLY